MGVYFLGSGQASAAEINETNTSEKVSTEQAQSTEEQPNHETSTQSVEQPQNKAIATQETKTNEDASSDKLNQTRRILSQTKLYIMILKVMKHQNNLQKNQKHNKIKHLMMLRHKK